MRPGSPGAFAVVAAGGAVGGLLRFAATHAVPDAPLGVAWTTLTVNVVGAFALGVLVAGPLASGAPAWLRPALATGLLGGFTTWSAVAVALERSAAAGAWGGAVGYLVLTLAVGTAAAAAGLGVGARWAVRRADREDP